jgi:hypothetical protein
MVVVAVLVLHSVYTRLAHAYRSHDTDSAFVYGLAK